MKKFELVWDRNSKPITGSSVISTDVESLVFSDANAQNVTIPPEARVAIFTGNGDFYVYDRTGAALPANSPTAGSQTVDVGGAITGVSVTGLANDATQYTATIAVDGGDPQTITVVGSAAQTYADLVTEINADLSDASVAISGGNLVVTSGVTGRDSSISIDDTDLFSSLTDFVEIEAAVDGIGNAELNPSIKYVGDLQGETISVIADGTSTDVVVTISFYS